MKNIKFTNLERQKTIDSLEGEIFDLVVIGGGITGGGIALDAASRGLKMVHMVNGLLQLVLRCMIFWRK